MSHTQACQRLVFHLLTAPLGAVGMTAVTVVAGAGWLTPWQLSISSLELLAVTFQHHFSCYMLAVLVNLLQPCPLSDTHCISCGHA
jgi:hypothetical protein